MAKYQFPNSPELDHDLDASRAERVYRNPYAGDSSRFSSAAPVYRRLIPVKPALEVLIVDDNREAAEELAWLVSGWGYSPRVAYDGLAGLRSADFQRPDLVVTYLDGRPLSGRHFAKQLRRNFPGRATFIIGITDQPEVGRRPLAADEIDIVLTAPIDPLVLETFLMLEQVRVCRAAKVRLAAVAKESASPSKTGADPARRRVPLRTLAGTEA